MTKIQYETLIELADQVTMDNAYDALPLTESLGQIKEGITNRSTKEDQDMMKISELARAVYRRDIRPSALGSSISSMFFGSLSVAAKVIGAIDEKGEIPASKAIALAETAKAILLFLQNREIKLIK